MNQKFCDSHNPGGSSRVWRLAALLVVCLPLGASHADYLVHDGRIYVGRFEGVTGGRFVIRTRRGPQRLPVRGSRLQIGREDVPACLLMTGQTEADCKLRIFWVGRKEVLVGYPNPRGYFVAGRLSITQVVEVILKSPKRLPIVEAGVRALVRTNKRLVEGKWTGADPDRVVLITEKGRESFELADVREVIFAGPFEKLQSTM